MRAIEYGLADSKDYVWVGLDREKAKDERRTFAGTLACYSSLRGAGWAWGRRSEELPPPLPRKHFFLCSVIRLALFLAQNAAASKALGFTATSSNMSLDGLFDLARLPHPPSQLNHCLVGLVYGWAAWTGVEIASAGTTVLYYVVTAALRAIMPVSMRPAPFDHRLSPPQMIPPYRASSVRAFWSQHWHSLIRRSVVFLGTAPTLRLFGRNTLGYLCATMAAFLISGLVHDFQMTIAVDGHLRTYSGLDNFRNTVWFCSQGLAICAEQVFTAVTGRKVRGAAGWLWTALWFSISSGYVARLWLDRGVVQL